ncbi:MAG: GrpB family protein, partial [Proteocatella sp.]
MKPLGDWDELYFRDYLRQYPAVARQYEALKLELKEKFEHNRDAYTYAKTEFVKEQSQKAKVE